MALTEAQMQQMRNIAGRELRKYKVSPAATVKQKEKDEESFFQKLAQTAASPFLRALTTGVAAIQGATNLATGDVEGAQAAMGDRDFGYFGKVSPYGRDADTLGEFARDVVGGGLELGSNFVGLGVADDVARSAVAGGRAMARSGLKTASKTAAMGTAAGAASGAGQSLQEGDDLKATIKNAFVQGLAGGAVIGLGSAVSRGVSSAAKSLPRRLYNSALGVTKTLEIAGRSPADDLLDKNVVGSLGSLYRKAVDGADDMAAKVSQILSSSEKTVPSANIIDEAVNDLAGRFGKTYSEQDLRAIVESLPLNALKQADELPVKVANELRHELDSITPSKYFVSDATQSLKIEAMGTVANKLREAVQTAEKATRPLFKDWSMYIQTRNLVADKIAGIDTKFGLGFGDLLFGGALTTGSGSLPAAIAGVGARKALGSASVKTRIAVGVKQVSSVIDRLPTDAAGNVSKAAVIAIIRGLLGDGEDAQSAMTQSDR